MRTTKQQQQAREKRLKELLAVDDVVLASVSTGYIGDNNQEAEEVVKNLDIEEMRKTTAKKTKQEPKQATSKQKQATQEKQATPKQKQERQEKQAEETKQEKKQGGVSKVKETHSQTIRHQQAITRNGEPAVIKLFKYEDAETSEIFEMELGALLYSSIVDGGISYKLTPNFLRIDSQKSGFSYSLASKELATHEVRIFEGLHKGFKLEVDVDEKLDRLALIREDASEKVKKIKKLMEFCKGLFYNYIENTKDIPYSLEDEKVQGTNEKIETEKAVEIAKKELEECVNGEFNIQVSGSFKTFITKYGSVEYFEVIKDNTKGTTVLELNRKLNTFKGLYFKDLREKELKHLLELNRQTEKYRKIKDYHEEVEKIKKAEKMEESKKREERIKKLMEDYRKQQATKQAETKQTPKQAKTKQATPEPKQEKQEPKQQEQKQAETKQETPKQAEQVAEVNQIILSRKKLKREQEKQRQENQRQEETKQEEPKQEKQKQEPKQQKQEPKQQKQEQKQEPKQQKQEQKQEPKQQKQEQKQEPKQQEPKQEGKPEKMEDDVNMEKMEEMMALVQTLTEQNKQAIEKIEQLEEKIEKNKPIYKKIADKVKKAKASAVAKVQGMKASAVAKVQGMKASAVGVVVAIIPPAVKEEIRKQGNQAEEVKQAEPKQAEPKQAEEVKQAEQKKAEPVAKVKEVKKAEPVAKDTKQESPIDAKIENIKKTNIKKILAEQGDEVVHFFNLKTIYRVQTISGKIYDIKKDKTAEEIAEMIGE